MAPGGMGRRGRQRGQRSVAAAETTKAPGSSGQDFYYAAMLIKGVGMMIEKDT